MALLESKAPQIGAPLPPFRLPDVTDGTLRSPEDYPDAEALLIMFLCGHCPYVIAVEDRILALARRYGGQPVQFLAICSNDPTAYPQDAPQALAQRVREKHYPFPYLSDKTQEVARAFDAVCTPEFFLYDKQRSLFYHGRLDDNWKQPDEVQHEELAAALDACLAGQAPPQPQHPSMGCSIKWTHA